MCAVFITVRTYAKNWEYLIRTQLVTVFLPQNIRSAELSRRQRLMAKTWLMTAAKTGQDRQKTDTGAHVITLGHTCEDVTGGVV